jgi:hypothetical protein
VGVGGGEPHPAIIYPGADCVIAHHAPKDADAASVATAQRHCVGEWLSLVEHLVRDQGVGGSNPLSPTNIFRALSQSLHQIELA